MVQLHITLVNNEILQILKDRTGPRYTESDFGCCTLQFAIELLSLLLQGADPHFKGLQLQAPILITVQLLS